MEPSGLKDGTDSANIAAAIAALPAEGGKISFADGTYYITNAITLSKAIELVGNDTDRSKVIIDAQNVSYVRLIYLNNAQSFVHGFRFQNSYLGPNGVGSDSDYIEGPVTISSGVISNCTVKMSKTSKFNGGVGMWGGKIVDCDITGCSSSDGGPARIGGALRMSGSTCVADRLTITNNSSRAGVDLPFI